jgi:hypothetical protein
MDYEDDIGEDVIDDEVVDVGSTQNSIEELVA